MAARRVVAAMSGGVDSSVMVARLVAEGYDVLGVHLALKGEFGGQRIDASTKGCGTPTDADDAALVAERLGIPFEVWDLADGFRENVVDPFLAAYARGETPNPCLRCNSTMKFGRLMEIAAERGYDAVGTGHYARVGLDADGRPWLRRSADAAKDQSYVMAVLSPDQLSRCLFPLGEIASKAAVRHEADELGLSHVASKPDSTDICFIPDGETAGFLTRHLGQAPGAIVDESGTVLAHHTGTHQFTVGQRRGLGIKIAPEDGQRRFVLSLQSDTRTVVVGPESAMLVQQITATQLNWLVDPADLDCAMQLSAHGRTTPVRLHRTGDSVTAVSTTPFRRPAAGQQAVFYDGDRVLCAGTVSPR
ncbi:MAG: tRNA 2-thiouridine(34) synthase MnmA [Propionibacteriaceae bacterium]